MSLLFSARGRGFARLIEGLGNGDPVAWGILGVVGLFFVGSMVVKSRKKD
jgi:hypothetical protein